MKIFALIITTLFAAFVCQSQPALPQRPPPAMPSAEPAKELVNYTIRVEWREAKGDPKHLELLTTEGQFNLDTIQKNSVKINDNEVPITLKLSGSLTELAGDKAKLQLFLGRTVPYVTGTHGSGPLSTSSYSQLSVGLNSGFVVKFGKAQVIQSDENGDISILVKRLDK